MDDSVLIEIQRLCQIVHERGLHELSITQPAFSVSLTAMQVGTVMVVPPSAHVLPVAHPAKAEEAVAPAGHAITTPIIGTFYRASSPDSPPFVEVGDHVEVGQTVGIVEAMKVFNEITSDIAGTVVAILAQNGQLLKVDEPLVILKPLG